jgi:hypothetical protein
LNPLLHWQRQPRVVHALGFLILFILAACLDHIVDLDLSLFALYLVPTLYTAWYLGVFGDTSAVLTAPRFGSPKTGGRGSSLTSSPDSLLEFCGKAHRLGRYSGDGKCSKRGAEGKLKYETERRNAQKEFEIASDVQLCFPNSQIIACRRLRPS